MRLRTLKVDYNCTLIIFHRKIINFFNKDFSYSEFEEFKDSLKDLLDYLNSLISQIERYEHVSDEKMSRGFLDIK